MRSSVGDPRQGVRGLPRLARCGHVSFGSAVEKALGDIKELAVGLGETITGEHGVGQLKNPWLACYLGPDAIELNRRIKCALDPGGILNPGVVV